MPTMCVFGIRMANESYFISWEPVGNPGGTMGNQGVPSGTLEAPMFKTQIETHFRTPSKEGVYTKPGPVRTFVAPRPGTHLYIDGPRVSLAIETTQSKGLCGATRRHWNGGDPKIPWRTEGLQKEMMISKGMALVKRKFDFAH